LHLEFLLDLLDALADDRLADVELMRGSAEASVAGAGHDEAKMAQVQLFPSFPRRHLGGRLCGGSMMSCG